MIEEKGLDSHPILIPNLPISSTAKRKKIDSNYYMFHDAKRASLVGFNAKKIIYFRTKDGSSGQFGYFTY